MSCYCRQLFILIILSLLSFNMKGQQVLTNQPEQDCFGAIPICYTTYSTTASYSGSGLLPNEININYSCLSSGEKNDVWYLFRTHSAGTISFTITPVNPQDDYDWAVFNTTHTSCANIYNNPSMEVSCNYDANIGCNGVTGPNGNVSPCGQTESVIHVQADEIYLINISNYSSSQSGYTIDFSQSTATIFDNTPPLAFNDTLSCTQTSVKVTFNEPVACSSLTFSGSDFAMGDNEGNKIFPQSIIYTGCDSLHPYITEAELFFNAPLGNSSEYYLLAVAGSDHNTLADLCGNYVAVDDTLATFFMLNNLTANLGSDVFTCPSAEFPLLYSPATSATDYNWYHNGLLMGTNNYYQPNDTGTYVLLASSGTRCFASDTIEFFSLPTLQISLSGNLVACEGEPLPTLSATVSDSSAQVLWFENGLPADSNSITYQPLHAGVIAAMASSAGFCNASASVVISVSNPAAPVISSQPLCEGGSALLQATIPGSGNLVWLMQSDTLAINQSSVTVFASGDYKTIYTDNYGCTSSDSIKLQSESLPAAPQLECPMYSLNGNIFSWQPVVADSLLLSTDEGKTFSSLPGSITSYTSSSSVHSIQLAAANGQCRSATVVSPICDTYITQLLSPTSADYYFTINGLETPISLTIYDARGGEVFFKSDYQNDWSAPQLGQGIYFYSIKAGKAHYISGRFLILK
jgi:hypothetical protein